MKAQIEIRTVTDGELIDDSIFGQLYRLTKITGEPITTPNKVRRRYHNKPKDAVGKDKVYGTWILQSEINAVHKAILHVEQNYLPCTEGVQRITGFGIQRCRAILHFMKDKQMITSKRDKRMRMIHRVIE